MRNHFGRRAIGARCAPVDPLIALSALMVVALASISGAAEASPGSACVECHESAVATTVRDPHGVLDSDPARAAHYDVDSSCAGCHGDPTAHLDSLDPADIVTFEAGAMIADRGAVCLSCHAKDQPRFHRTTHAQVGLDCLSCHAIHQPEVRPYLLTPSPVDASLEFGDLVDLDAGSTTCVGCHSSALADFEFNERHRLQEGILGCVDCHDPHAPSGRRLLGGFKQQQCAQCHADKTGPFIFEHGAQRVEGCVACHESHGGPNRHQLKFQNVAQLCYSCHIAVPGFHARFTEETGCTNCHSAIHGSNFDPAFLK